jgi:hypothetical protein
MTIPHDLGTGGFILSVVALVIMLADRSRAKILERIQKLQRELDEANDLPLLEEGQHQIFWAICVAMSSPLSICLRVNSPNPQTQLRLFRVPMQIAKDLG